MNGQRGNCLITEYTFFKQNFKLTYEADIFKRLSAEGPST